MKCPACSNELKLWKVGTIDVDVCDGGCGGVWFDAFELQKIGQAKESLAAKLQYLRMDPNVKVDPRLKRQCPRCSDIKLKRHFFSPQTKVHVDQCPNCGGYWLDHGELAAIHSELRARVRPQTEDGQEMSMEVIRFLYRMKTRDSEDSTPPPTQ